jgi:AAA+ ATPase superfamily predicted ATPase
MNPFNYGRVVSRKNYCGRPDLEATLKGRLLAVQNTYLEGERRTGKTSLIIETVSRIKSRRLVYIDLLEVKTIEDVHKRALNGIIKAEGSGNFIQTLFKSVAALRPTITFDPVTGLPTLSIDAVARLRPESLEGLLDIFSRREYRNAVVVIDEFQDILNLPDASKVLAVMRGRIQFLRSVPFVFCGSIRGKMNTIFTDHDSPFFKSALPIEVGPIDHSAFRRFIAQKFSEAKIRIAPEMIERILHIALENPGDTQQLCAAVYGVTSPNDVVGEKTIMEALQQIYAEERKGYEACLANITAMQLKCLTAVARLGGKNTFARDFLTHTGIRQPSTIRKSLSRLEYLKILFKTNHEYRYVNPFFAQWLVWMNY